MGQTPKYDDKNPCETCEHKGNKPICIKCGGLPSLIMDAPPPEWTRARATGGDAHG